MTWEQILHILIHTLEDTARLIPFLLVAYLLIEWLEHKAGDGFERFLKRSGRFGSAVGGLLGMVPQCGFSVVCANFYAGRIVTTGTVVAVMLATSDEALPIMLASNAPLEQILALLGAKLVIGVVTGFLVDALYKRKEQQPGQELCQNCGCEHDHGFVKSVLLPALRHVGIITAFLFVITLVLNGVIEAVGEDNIASFLGGSSLLQPIVAALFGFIPNCAASVVITQLYIAGGLSFGSAVAGLCTGAGAGMLVLVKANRNMKENLFIAAVMFVAASVSGVLLQLFVG